MIYGPIVLVKNEIIDVNSTIYRKRLLGRLCEVDL